MGITTGFLVLLFTNIERTIHVIKIRPVKALIVILLVSTVMGLFQKWLALRLQIGVDVQVAGKLKMVEVVKDHSGESKQTHMSILERMQMLPICLPSLFPPSPSGRRRSSSR